MTAYDKGFKHAIEGVHIHYDPAGWNPRKSFEYSMLPASAWDYYLQGYVKGYNSPEAEAKARGWGEWKEWHRWLACEVCREKEKV